MSVATHKIQGKQNLTVSTMENIILDFHFGGFVFVELYISSSIILSLCKPYLISRCGHTDIVKYLVTQAHCDPNIKNKYGHTPLHYACK